METEPTGKAAEEIRELYKWTCRQLDLPALVSRRSRMSRKPSFANLRDKPPQHPPRRRSRDSTVKPSALLNPSRRSVRLVGRDENKSQASLLLKCLLQCTLWLGGKGAVCNH
jgi:hypothetical protein